MSVHLNSSPISLFSLLSQDELKRHGVWWANKLYVEEHNLNMATALGYHLKMNQFGDMVSYVRTREGGREGGRERGM